GGRLDDRGGLIVQLRLQPGQVALSGNPEDQDGKLGWVEPVDKGRLQGGIIREPLPGALDLLQYVDCGRADIGSVVELDPDDRGAVGRSRSDLVDVGCGG